MSTLNKDEIATISIRWLLKQASTRRWNLSYSDLAILLDVDEQSVREFEHNVELRTSIVLKENTRIRLTMLLSINKAIHNISPAGHENSFFTSPNSGRYLKGVSIKQFLIKEATNDAMNKVIIFLKSKI
jgi:hypothetical protein